MKNGITFISAALLQLIIATNASAQLHIVHIAPQPGILPSISKAEIANLDLIKVNVAIKEVDANNLSFEELASISPNAGAEPASTVAVPVTQVASIPTPPSVVSTAVANNLNNTGTTTYANNNVDNSIVNQTGGSVYNVNTNGPHGAVMPGKGDLGEVLYRSDVANHSVHRSGLDVDSATIDSLVSF